ncbi:MAG: hypothetical protein HY396_00600 [Candidatus Doudnabacteria bacterium]|nr:hypothetical protein [Candidatus Doudnabacteria bacterium]
MEVFNPHFLDSIPSILQQVYEDWLNRFPGDYKRLPADRFEFKVVNPELDIEQHFKLGPD